MFNFDLIMTIEEFKLITGLSKEDLKRFQLKENLYFYGGNHIYITEGLYEI